MSVAEGSGVGFEALREEMGERRREGKLRYIRMCTLLVMRKASRLNGVTQTLKVRCLDLHRALTLLRYEWLDRKLM